jgi:rifampin ADP-ribosylating transferase
MTRDNYCRPHERDESAGALPVYEAGVYLHGTKAELLVGEMLVPGRESNFEEGRVMNYVYFTATLDPAVWGAELASGEGRRRVDIVDRRADSKTTPTSRTGGFPGIRRSPFAAASRCAS